MGVLSMKCPHCGEQAAMQTFGVLVAQSREPHRIQRPIKFVASAVCPACKGPVCAELRSEKFDAGYEIVREMARRFHEEYYPPGEVGCVVIDAWPKEPEPDIPRHLPNGIAAKLLEAEQSFAAKIFTGAAGLYRSLIDLTTKEQLKAADLGEKGTLEARLDRLSENHIIPDAVAAWGHEVRAVGNEALHDELTVSEADAKAIRYFALTYLRYAYELPGDIAERRAQAAKAVPPKREE